MSESIAHRFHELPVLVDRLARGAAATGRKITFVVGAPLSSPELPGDRGVPGVSGMIDLIRSRLDSPAAIDHFNRKVPLSSNKYQAAFELLNAHRGQDAVNEIVRQAVLSARVTHSEQGSSPLQPKTLDPLENLETDVDGWALPPGVRTLGKLIAEHPHTFGSAVLTSNFDPLIEVSIRRSGGNYYRTVLHGDGDLAQSAADGCHVVHFHGFWVGRDTLHTPIQLNQPRPRLRQSLAHLLSSSTVVVLAYGGWDDVFTHALVDIALDDAGRPDVLWTFFGTNEEQLQRENHHVLQRLEPGIARGRVSLFKGIDCNTFLPRLLQELTDERSTQQIALNETVSSRLIEVRDATSAASHIELRIRLPSDLVATYDADSPPHIDEWVGRDGELRFLEGSHCPAIVITGIGGQGKSTLAAYYLKQVELEDSFEEWDWRDCREEGDRLTTQLTRIIERIAGPSFDLATYESLDLASLIDILFRYLRGRRWLFVFDNVDRYVDLVSGQFVSGLDSLLEAVLTKQHRSRFIFTCRPNVKTESPLVLRLPLSGLSKVETAELFKRRGVGDDQLSDIDAAYELTNGHPLWINVIAMQAVRVQGSLRAVLDDIRRGKGELPERTLRSIWAGLNDNQKTLLRTLAELERAVTEDRLFQMVGLTGKSFARAMKALRALHLIVIKSRPGELELLELHPLVRSFVRGEFPRQDRDRFINVIVQFLDRMIGRYKGMLDKQPSLAILDHWSQKAELDINRGRCQDAVHTIVEVSGSLLARGYAEEFARLGKRLLDAIDWAEACSTYKAFNELMHRLIEIIIQLGQYEAAEGYLRKYEQAIPGKSALYINLCDLQCYLHWYQEKFSAAISWGEQGETLAKTSSVDTRFSTAHNLALARRDNGDIERALSYFLRGAKLEDILDNNAPSKEMAGSFYGNVGRCLALGTRLSEALIVYRKSASRLEEDASEQLNKGYVRLWIGEVLAEQNRKELAAVFINAAIYQWEDVSPPRARKARARLAEFGLRSADDREAEELEQAVRNWIGEQT